MGYRKRKKHQQSIKEYKMNKIYNIYKELYTSYGPQGWWPFLDVKDNYHPLDYNYPKNENQIFEVCLASILTQNRNFTSVVKSLHNLKNENLLNYKKIKKAPIDKIKELIKPSGYQNQKTNYILNYIDFFEKLNGRIPSRNELLAIKGIGPETADSMLLYGFNQREFKIDAYTKRVLVYLKIFDEKAKYHDMKYFMEDELKKEIKDEKELLITYQEFHALIVRHAKVYYSKKPYGNGCFLSVIV